ncbi:hypothetical protein NDU88_008097 [Pleurodeles waltl]|uniref:Uncharacterized protein n=1 Tax=Pleurodeles waltl TaxID=8319 RepID=A0AAV7RS07_PLEWA|nr:hypothetical protein NDU88_008097 [Pleurodeles waltl]
MEGRRNQGRSDSVCGSRKLRGGELNGRPEASLLHEVQTEIGLDAALVAISHPFWLKGGDADSFRLTAGAVGWARKDLPGKMGPGPDYKAADGTGVTVTAWVSGVSKDHLGGSLRRIIKEYVRRREAWQA